MKINGIAVATIRERSGLTQSLLSEMSGSISQGRISEIEAQNVISVRPATAVRLAETLGVPLMAILAEQEVVG